MKNEGGDDKGATIVEIKERKNVAGKFVGERRGHTVQGEKNRSCKVIHDGEGLMVGLRAEQMTKSCRGEEEEGRQRRLLEKCGGGGRDSRWREKRTNLQYHIYGDVRTVLIKKNIYL